MENPKSEVRSPKDIRNRKSEEPAWSLRDDLVFEWRVLYAVAAEVTRLKHQLSWSILTSAVTALPLVPEFRASAFRIFRG